MAILWLRPHLVPQITPITAMLFLLDDNVLLRTIESEPHLAYKVEEALRILELVSSGQVKRH